MGEPLVLTFDVGTQSTRCLLVKKDGSFADICQVKYDEPYFSENPGWAEQKPDFYFEKICETGKTVCSRSKALLGDIVSVTITVIRDTALCLDKDYKPLRNVILWLDKRQAQFDSPFGFFKKLAFKLVGMEDSVKILYRASVGNWLMQNEPETWAKTEKYVMLPTYLNYRLTGVLADTAANMIGHIPFDYEKRCWMSKSGLTRCVCDVPAEKLCDLVAGGETIGKITEEVSALTGIPAGLPLIATGSDKGCETLGLSVVKSNKAAVSFGTTATIQMAVEKYFEPQQFMPAYPAVPKNLYNPEIQIYRGFWLLSWFVQEFGKADCEDAAAQGTYPEKLLDERIAEIPAGSGGLLVQPFWSAGVKNCNALGAMVGFSDFHTRYHIYRAIIEGLALELYQSLKTMEKRSGLKVDEIFIGGGGAKSDIVCRITADVFGLPVKRIQTHEACALGSSMVGFISAGEFKDYDEAIASMVHEKDVFTPNAAEHETYMQIFEQVYSKLESKLEPLNKKLNVLNKRI